MLFNETRESIWDRKIPLVTVMSVIAYTLAYCYQFSMASFFRYPTTFIIVDVNSILKTLSVTAFVFTPIFLAMAFSFKIYTINRWWIVFVLMGLVFFVFYLSFVGFVSPLEFYRSGGWQILSAIATVSLYPLLLTWQILLDGHRSLRHLPMVFVLLGMGFLFLCVLSFAQLNAWASAGEYNIKEKSGYYIITTVGDKLLVGRCGSTGMDYKLLDAGSETTFVRSNKNETSTFRSCLLNVRNTSS